MLERVRPIAEGAGIRLLAADPMQGAVAYRLFTLPTLLLFSGGEERVRIQGVRGRRAILRKLGPWLGSSRETEREAVPPGLDLVLPEKSAAR